MVGRLVTQKGFDIVLAACSALARLSVQMVALGTGETRLERLMRSEAASRYQFGSRCASATTRPRHTGSSNT